MYAMAPDMKTMVNSWYNNPTVRDLIYRQYETRWGDDTFTKELCILDHNPNSRMKIHGKRGLTYKNLNDIGDHADAYEYMKGANVYQSLLSYGVSYPEIQSNLIKLIDPRTDWLRSVSNHRLFEALKYRADLIKSFTFAFDIDLHSDNKHTMRDMFQQAYMIGSFFKDTYQFEPILNISGGGMHCRFPDYLIAQAIDIDRLLADHVKYSHDGYSWIDMAYINSVLVQLTERVTEEVFGNKPGSNNVDLQLHNNSSRVFRTLYTIHPATGTVVLPVRLKHLPDLDYDSCHISNVAHFDDTHVTLLNKIVTEYRNIPYTYDWSTATNKTVPADVSCQVRKLLHILYTLTPVSFHKYLNLYEFGVRPKGT